MTSRRTLRASLALAALTTTLFAGSAPNPLPENCRLVAGAETETPDDDREVCELRTYFHCTSEVKLHNAALIVDGLTSWDENPPQGSFQSGEGCGSVQASSLRGSNPATLYDTGFSGTFTGRLDNLQLELHARDIPMNGSTSADVTDLDIYLEIDGKVRLNWVPLEDIYGTPSSTGATAAYRISFAGIGLTGLNDDVEHTVTLTVSRRYANAAAAFVWDAVEVPSGITFNSTKLTAPTVFVPS